VKIKFFLLLLFCAAILFAQEEFQEEFTVEPAIDENPNLFVVNRNFRRNYDLYILNRIGFFRFDTLRVIQNVPPDDTLKLSLPYGLHTIAAVPRKLNEERAMPFFMNGTAVNIEQGKNSYIEIRNHYPLAIAYMPFFGISAMLLPTPVVAEKSSYGFLSMKYQQGLVGFRPKSVRGITEPAANFLIDQKSEKTVLFGNINIEGGRIWENTLFASNLTLGGSENHFVLGTGILAGMVFSAGEAFKFIPAFNLGYWYIQNSYKDSDNSQLFSLDWYVESRLFGGPDDSSNGNQRPGRDQRSNQQQAAQSPMLQVAPLPLALFLPDSADTSHPFLFL